MAGLLQSVYENKINKNKSEVMYMSMRDFEMLLFYMWQLKLNTIGEVAYIKRHFKIDSNKGLLDKLCELYNSDYYLDLAK